MKIQTIGIAAAVLILCHTATAQAAPGLGSEVYGATVDDGELELESIYGRLAGGPDEGEDTLALEAAYGISEKLRVGVRGEFEREPNSHREFEALGVEAIYELGRAGGIDFAAYGEYEIVFEGTDKFESKLLMQRRDGPLDIRFNLIAEKELSDDEPLEFEYAASASIETIGELDLGIQAFGELGTLSNFLPRAEHFLGPVAKVEIEGLGPEIEIEAGYLFALGAAREDTDGQFRLALEFEF